MATKTLLPEPKYFGVHGTLEGYVPGLYIVEAPDALSARKKLFYSSHNKSIEIFGDLQVQEIKGEWAKVLSDTIDQIQNKMKEYYVDLGNGVYYVEI